MFDREMSEQFENQVEVEQRVGTAFTQ